MLFFCGAADLLFGVKTAGPPRSKNKSSKSHQSRGCARDDSVDEVNEAYKARRKSEHGL